MIELVLVLLFLLKQSFLSPFNILGKLPEMFLLLLNLALFAPLVHTEILMLRRQHLNDALLDLLLIPHLLLELLQLRLQFGVDGRVAILLPALLHFEPLVHLHDFQVLLAGLLQVLLRLDRVFPILPEILLDLVLVCRFLPHFELFDLCAGGLEDLYDAQIDQVLA